MMRFSVRTPRLLAMATLLPLAMGSLTGCASSVEKSSEPTGSATEAKTSSSAPSSTPAKTAESTTSTTGDVLNLTATGQNNATLQTSAQELQQADEERAEKLKAQNKDPEDPYLKFGDILCGGEVLPTVNEVKAMGAGEAYLAWFTRLVESAPQEVKSMSETNAAAHNNKTMIQAQPDRQKCAAYWQSN
ncbi:MAG: hypothetical protein Q3974_04580 [Rothia sp. (in: high G+C Gram-positive bacteria)]|nr:hypothetical protein [Rothia sp. (in: high G+C Gram-positive bacteria)]